MMNVKRMFIGAIAAFGLALGSLGVATTAQAQDCTVDVTSGAVNVDVNWC